MKKIFLVITFGFTVCMSQAQKIKSSDLPASVKNAFETRFPKAQQVRWSKENDTEFEAEFRSNQKQQSANFDKNGKWLVTESEISLSQVPPSVKATIDKEFTGYKIEESELIENNEGSSYEFELRKGGERYEAKISKDGKLTQKEALKIKDKD